MREIKFRAWDKRLSDYIAWEIILDDGFNKYYCDEYCILEQFTGLCDKNGKEIYEGDIVKAKPYGYPICISTIEYFEKHGIFGLKHVGKYKGDIPMGSLSYRTKDKPFTWSSYSSIEVIGNIHENPELLQEVKSGATIG